MAKATRFEQRRRFVEDVIRCDKPAIASLRFAKSPIGGRMPRVVLTHHRKETARIDEQFIRHRGSYPSPRWSAIRPIRQYRPDRRWDRWHRFGSGRLARAAQWVCPDRSGQTNAL